ncbi:hypothetical protein JOF53_004412 [Crossiella equi]|uniref:Uncharacterized protein n=1 Tax=Crossiella equi TaxID=130796 RepID=A0ABS5AIK9_9PSEU|nr:hypothetical protein [Crossiella equi]MBP2475540.1 hypothetical protein [Crossiella equi]
MTTNEARPGVPDGPPWSVDLIADLHAGVLDPHLAAALRPRVEADPEGSAILAALDETQAELADLPPLRMPDHVAARIEAAIEHEVRQAMAGARTAPPVPQQAPRAQQAPPVAPFPQRAPQPAYAGPPPGQQPPAPVLDLASARRRRNRSIGWGIGAVVGLAAATGLVFAVLPGSQPVGGQAQPGTSVTSAPADQSGPLALTESDLDGTKVPGGVVGQRQLGPFSDPAKQKACLTRHNAGSAVLLAGRQITVGGKSGVLFLLSTETIGRQRLLVVADDCSLIKDVTVGR